MTKTNANEKLFNSLKERGDIKFSGNYEAWRNRDKVSEVPAPAPIPVSDEESADEFEKELKDYHSRSEQEILEETQTNKTNFEKWKSELPPKERKKFEKAFK